MTHVRLEVTMSKNRLTFTPDLLFSVTSVNGTTVLQPLRLKCQPSLNPLHLLAIAIISWQLTSCQEP